MTLEIVVSGIKISNPQKLVYKNPNVTKLEIVKYYEKIFDYIMPFLRNRLLSVVRCFGDLDNCFYKKHPQINLEGERFLVTSDKGKDSEYFYIKTKTQFLYQVQLGTLEFHPWASTVKNLSSPNVMVFDLDPDESVSLKEVRRGVLEVKNVLDELGLVSFLKTSGGKGYHIVVPIKCSSFEKSEKFAKTIALLLERKFPNRFISYASKEKRKGKIFIDWLRNKKGATSVAPFSLRAREGATISMPILWNDLETAPKDVNIYNVDMFLAKNAWKNFFDVKQEIK